MTRTDNKLTLVKTNFSMKNYNALLKLNVTKLSATARDLFYFIESFGRLHNINDTVSTWMLEGSVQKINTYTCGPFQLFFFENLSIALEK